jgi:hypothetical protein
MRLRIVYTKNLGEFKLDNKEQLFCLLCLFYFIILSFRAIILPTPSLGIAFGLAISIQYRVSDYYYYFIQTRARVKYNGVYTYTVLMYVCFIPVFILFIYLYNISLNGLSLPVLED